jgi:activating signal cointegrator complex subunit 3
MEQALLQLETERTPQEWEFDREKVLAATAALANVLRDLIEQDHAARDQQQDGSIASSQSAINAGWLFDLCKAHTSSSSTLMSPSQLARAVWSASQLQDEAQQQGALFDALGESGMDLLLQVASQLSQIRSIPERDLDKLEQHQAGGSVASATATYVDPEEARRQRLLQEARDAAQVAAIAKAEVESLDSPSASATHRVMRKSEIQAQKAAQKATKRAEAAWKAARDAGAIVDESEFLSLDASGNVLGAGGLMGQSQEQIWELQHSLKQSGTREYHEQQGLPKGTIREYGEGFEKVLIPAPVRDESKLPKRLVINEIMDSEYAKAFAGTESLNPMQSQVFETAFHRRDNMLVCAPTGAGKTNVAMLAVTAHFRDVGLIRSSSHMANFVETGRKVVYIAPMKALAQEVVEKFQSKLQPLGLIVRELTGDMQLTRAEAEAAHVIVTTPEKWDVVTRKSGNDDNSLGNQCGLLIIDEVHLLADDRGAVIESVVARVHRLVESRQRQVRIVALSATLPNYEDVATFLQVPQRGLFFFGPEHRPVPLQQQFIGVNVQTRDRFVRENKMNDLCYDVVVDSLRRGHQVMVFVHSRKGTGDTATALADRASKNSQLESLFVTQGKDSIAGEAHSRFVDRVRKSRNREVGNHFQNGMGIHHAGMLRGDRKLTERMFAEGAINVLCCTATLAWGVNLPAHTVVVKGTEVYNPEKGGTVDLSILDVQQIFGRAGRPDYVSDFGEATLITTHDALARYLDKLVRSVPIESNFIKQLADHLNAEVVGGTVTNIQEAATWLTYTYLHVRMLRNPLAYGISADQKADDPMLRGRSRELVHEAAKLLDSNQMLRYSVETGNLGVTDLGRVAAHFYIQAESVATFNDKLGNYESLSDADLLHLVCCATEFENVKIRQEELDEVDSLAKKACPLPVKLPVHEPSDKSYVLLQAFISRAGVKSFTLISDTNYIASNAGRVARAMFEMCLRQNKADPALKLLRIAKCVDKRFWWFQTPLRHFESELKSNVFAALESRKVGAEKGYDAFEAAVSLLDLEPREVGELCHWAKGGGTIQRFIRLLPRLDVRCTVQPVTSSVLRFHITLRPLFQWQNRWHGGSEAFWLWVEDGESNRM